MKRTGAWKGHCAMCAMNKGNWRRGKRRDREKMDVQRIMGRTRRIPRNWIPPEDK